MMLKYTNKYYWNNKTERVQMAKAHTEEMEARFHDEIAECFRLSRVYRGRVALPHNNLEHTQCPEFILANEDAVTAIFHWHREKTAVLNFSSYKYPGGMFLKGSIAQEESLCHSSYLYNVLRMGQQFYNTNRKSLNKALYTNAAVYSPNIRFMLPGVPDVRADVITCAAPNKTAALKYHMATEEENTRAIAARITFIRDICNKQTPSINTLILGAYGCGVFGQDPDMVSSLLISTFASANIKRIVFSVPGDNPNYRAFQKTMHNLL